jgi:hypothetical protein
MRNHWSCRDTVGDRGEDDVEELWTRNQDEVKSQENLSELGKDDAVSVFSVCSRDEEHRSTDQSRCSDGNSG